MNTGAPGGETGTGDGATGTGTGTGTGAGDGATGTGTGAATRGLGGATATGVRGAGSTGAARSGRGAGGASGAGCGSGAAAWPGRGGRCRQMSCAVGMPPVLPCAPACAAIRQAVMVSAPRRAVSWLRRWVMSRAFAVMRASWHLDQPSGRRTRCGMHNGPRPRVTSSSGYPR
ncbi:hypothetical protein GBO37_10445 [Paracoccus sp. 08]|nr:hypothetical protein [Paracoccus sp. 08]